MPSGIPIRSCRFVLRANTQIFRSPLAGTEQRGELPGAAWVASYTLSPRTRAEIAAVQAFLVALRGQANTFYGYDPAARTPQGTATGTPLVKGGSQTGTSLTTDGWTAGVTGIMKAGDYFSVGGELKMVTADANSDGSGNATISFEPALRNSPADNAPLTVTNPTCTMRLIDDEQAGWDVDEAGFYDISFSGVETFL